MNKILVFVGFTVAGLMFFLSIFLWFKFHVNNIVRDLMYFGSGKRWKPASASRTTTKLSDFGDIEIKGNEETTKLTVEKAKAYHHDTVSSRMEIIEEIILAYNVKKN